MSDTILKLEKLLSERSSKEIIREGDFVHASVMMILKKSDPGYSLLFIKRPESEKDPFSGHMAFPGGSMEKDDSSKLETAIRETHEEVGINITQSARIIGTLHDVNPNNPRARNYVVTPYLSVLNEEVTIIPEAKEVETTVWVPMRHLVDDRNKEIRIRERDGRQVEDYAYNYEQYLIWGMTGRILHQFLSFSAHLF
ncbi:MAG: coenzyme A pyrophosphatase [Thermodesulfobacteriota bacterium]|nr:MAG: coenzyme A pyrophosphatase [Thermodesulfobacteriota bacterium]